MTDKASAARVLVVEDETANRDLLRAILAHSTDARMNDAILVDAPSLAEARRVLDAQSFDVVLLDVRLPDGNGLDLTQDIAAIDAASRPQVVIVSASVLPGEQATALSSGADAFLGEPYRPADVVEFLTRLLENRVRGPD